MTPLRSLRRFGPAFSIALLVAASWVLYRELSLHNWQNIRADFRATPRAVLVAALLLTVVNYIVMTGYDWLSLRYANVRQSYPRVALASTLGFALSQALGFPLFTGAPMRVRLYGAWGVSGAQLARIIAFTGLTFWVGVLAVAGSFLAFAPPTSATLPPVVLRVTGLLMLVGLSSYLVWVVRGKPSFRITTIEIEPPHLRLAIGQIGLTTLDWIAASSVLFVLLPPGHGVPFAAFVGVFVTANVLGLLSHVPGGLGVFEASLFALMPSHVHESSLFAALVVYRIIYYFVPLFVAGVGLGVFEAFQRRDRASRVLSATASALPTALAAGVFVLGTALLIVGSLPIPPGRLRWLSGWLSPTVQNISHFVASLAGAGMIILARGLQRRLKGALHLALAALGGVAVLAVFAFASPSLSVASAVLALVMWSSREHFYRQSSIWDQALTPRWIAAVGVAAAAAAWLGFFAFKGVAFRNDMWWQFTFDADAPRFLRASVGIASVLLLVLVARLLRAAPHVPQPASESVLDSIAPIVAAAPRANANLAFLGDKSILVSDSGRSFLMYCVHRSNWITMGDPIGDPSEFESLLWRFRDEADRAGDAAVFYQVGPQTLHLYVDMGMSLFKLGEEGRIPLSGLTLEGKRWSDQRKALSKFEKLGAEFSVIERDEVASHLESLRAISEDWLTAKNTREKGFSLGRFDEKYISRNRVALVRVGGNLVAFASLWTGDSREEFSIDLMRYSSDAPKGVMDFVFAHLLLWAKDQGYRYFCLGMAPLAGLGEHRLAPAWHRLGDALFEHGERFYNFRGLHGFKEKFEPDWEPRYVAVQAPRTLPLALADITTLIAGGLRGVFVR